MARRASGGVMSAPKLEIALVCDGVRKEITGQETIIGVYPDTFNTETFPIGFMPSIYLRIKFVKAGTHTVQFRVTQGSNGIQLIQPAKFPINVNEAALSATIVLGPIPLTIQSAGRVDFGMKIEESDWEDIFAINFRQAEFKLAGPIEGGGPISSLRPS